MTMLDLADDMPQRALATAASWLGIGVAAIPVLDIADRAGLVVLLTSPETLELGMVAIPMLQIAAFVGLGIAAAALLRRHRPRVRWWFFAGCVAPIAAFTAATGFRLSVVVALIALCYSAVQLRLAQDAPPFGGEAGAGPRGR
jgi:hypothetical protein